MFLCLPPTWLPLPEFYWEFYYRVTLRAVAFWV